MDFLESAAWVAVNGFAIERYRMTSGVDRLITGLTRDLEPVRVRPPLRQALAIILTTWTALLGVILWTQEHETGLHSILMNWVYGSAFLGLLIASLGGTISALAAGVPGRERLELGGTVCACLGLAGAATACVIGIMTHGLPAIASPVGVDQMCFQKSAYLSLLPAGVILSFLVRGWAAHPIRASLITIVASGALGSLIVHASCSFMAPRHLIVSHLSVPIVLALLGFYPLAILLRRLRR
jgi:hypothetical protein